MKHAMLFEGDNLYMRAIDLEKDSAIVAAWTYQLELARQLRNDQPTRPLTASEVRKVFENWFKEIEQANRSYFFAICTSRDDRLVGILRISSVMWVHGAATFILVIGEAGDRAQFGSDALQMSLGYAFDELNLFRVTAVVEEHDEIARTLYDQARFYLEVRQRQAVFHNGRFWDRLWFGMLRPEWQIYQQAAEVAA
jgi:RimJ/RimL family protein N-acetyltransferase